MKLERSSGILFHITSLPSKYGIGDLGKTAYEFVDFLSSSKQKLWQILPTGPTGYGNSPYQTFSAFAGNSNFIDLDNLLEKKLFAEQDLADIPNFNIDKVEFEKVKAFKEKKLRIAFEHFDLNSSEYKQFLQNESWWLDDYAFFISLKQYFNNVAWTDWEEKIKLHQPEKVVFYENLLASEINYHKFCQFLFWEQWQKLKKYANIRGIKIIGDIPIFVSADSADVWSNPQIFQLDENNLPTKVAGVPPDYFSETGQLWGNPIYNWKVLEEQKFGWWLDRFEAMQKQVDIMRVDHFRGFEAYWAVDATEKTAINGRWEKALGDKLFAQVINKFGSISIIAEDLGIITKEVEELRDKYNFPGMKILQFAFDSDMENSYLPHNYPENCVVYTGTHDNDTTLGWWENISEKQKTIVKTYLQKEEIDICQDLVELAWKSKANIAIAPLQDFLCLDSSARMNIPGTADGNWAWRLNKKLLTVELSDRIGNMTLKYKR